MITGHALPATVGPPHLICRSRYNAPRVPGVYRYCIQSIIHLLAPFPADKAPALALVRYPQRVTLAHNSRTLPAPRADSQNHILKRRLTPPPPRPPTWPENPIMHHKKKGVGRSGEFLPSNGICSPFLLFFRVTFPLVSPDFSTERTPARAHTRTHARAQASEGASFR